MSGGQLREKLTSKRVELTSGLSVGMSVPIYVCMFVCKRVSRSESLSSQSAFVLGREM